MAAQKDETPELTRDEVADMLGVHAKTVERYVRQGRLPAYKVGARQQIRFKRSEIEAARDQIIPI